MSDKLPDVIISREVADFLLGVAACPNPECGDDCTIEAWTSAVASIAPDGYYQIVCSTCDYHAPRTTDLNTAIRLHNLLCRPTPQPTREAAQRALMTVISSEYSDAQHDGLDPHAAYECAIDEAYKFIEAAHPPKPEPTEAAADTADSAARQLSWRFKVRRSNDEIVPIEEIAAVVRAYIQRDAPKPTEEWMREAAKEICEFAKLPPGFASAHDVHIASIIAKHYENAK